jgi:hypothetical protein
MSAEPVVREEKLVVSLATELSGAEAFYAAVPPGAKRKMPNAFTQDAGEMIVAPLDAATTALFDAAAEGDAASVAALLSSGASADARPAPGGDTPLMRAAARGHSEVARMLLDAGADASARRADGFTPLILSVFYGHETVARLLVERGADPTARTKLGTTATRWAAARGFLRMEPMLREAEAARPRDDEQAVREHASTVSAGTRAVHAESGAGRTKATAPSSKASSSSSEASSSDEVSIFSRKSPRTDAPAASGAATSAPSLSSMNVSSSSATKVSTSGLSPLGLSQSSAPSPNLAQADAPASNVSVRSGGRIPAHPSASVFRVGDFLRSWQGSVGVALLLVAFGVLVFSLMRGGKTAGAVAPPNPTTTAPQAAAQPPVQQVPAPQPSPTLPAEMVQPVAPINDPAYVPPSTAAQPFYVPPSGPVQSDAPRELMVVSENGTPAAEEAGRTKRKTDANANNAAPAATPNERRAEPSATPDARPPRPAEAEQRPAQPAPSTPPPATQPTPRAKVIQWPPQ